MLPALDNGDRVLVIRVWPKHWLHKGQIVLVNPSSVSASSNQWSDNTLFVKRLTALPTETIVINAAHATTQVTEFGDTGDICTHHQAWYIPPHHIFVLADALGNYLDSRTWGPLPLRSVRGVVIMKLPRRQHQVAPSTHDQ